MAITERKGGTFFLDIQKKGVPRLRKEFTSKREAELFEREYLLRFSITPASNVVSDSRRLLDLINIWFRFHGVNLADGERRKRALEAIAAQLKNPIAKELTAEHFSQWRYDRMYVDADRLQAKTCNNLHGYLSAMFSKLKKLNIIDYTSPVCEVDFIKIQERQLSYLSKAQIDRILDEIKAKSINESTWYVAQLCLRTGARWGEAEQLRMKQLRDGRVTYEFTKSKKTRTVPLDPVFFAKLMEFAGPGRSPNDRVFQNCISAFRRAVARTGLELPRGQMTHILRHSFASHFMMSGGSILTLQKILGHADITQTMTYAHLAPEHLNDAIRLNPMA